MAAATDPCISRAIEGDLDALNRLLERCGPRLAAVLAGRIGSNWLSAFDVDDVIQVTFLEAFLRIDRCGARDERSFFNWLRRIAENNLTDAVRELSAAKRTPPGARLHAEDLESSRISLFEQLTTASTPSRKASGNEVRAILDQALGYLPADYQQVVRLYDLEGRPATEVGRTMGRSQGAVFMLRARAHDRLREVLGDGSRFFSDTA